MKKKIFEYTIFVLLNIYLGFLWFQFYVRGYITGFISFIIKKFIEKCFPAYIFDDYDSIIFIYCFVFLIPLISILSKIFIFPLLYKIRYFNNIKDFLEKFATDKRCLIKILLSVLIFDFIMYLLSFLFIGIHNWQGYIKDLEEIGVMYLMVFGGVFPCYLFFLLWHKFTHRNKTEIAQNSIRAL